MATVRILTQNMWGVPYVSKRKHPRFDKFCQDVLSKHDFDIICFQEVFSFRRGYVLPSLFKILVWMIKIFAYILFPSLRNVDASSLDSYDPRSIHGALATNLLKLSGLIDTFICTGASMIEGKFIGFLAEWTPLAFLVDIERLRATHNHEDKYIFIDAARRAWNGSVHHAYGPLPPVFSLSFVDSGLLVLSRYPLNTVGSLRYDHRSGIDLLAAKGVLACEVQVGSKSVVVLNTHMQAGGDIPTRAIRKQQVGQLADFVKHIKSSTMDPHVDRVANLILAGDLNTCSLSEVEDYEYLLQSIAHLSDALAHPHPATTDDDTQRLDYLLCADVASVKEILVMDYGVSDHKSVSAILSLRS
eukprot:GILK01010318.1.p1 GENE.GILK01010318.1~~GILK01010318.1.p1  ORF type:complete len:389 (-),score=38.70 GILK01010318.1:139-1212(-)